MARKPMLLALLLMLAWLCGAAVWAGVSLPNGTVGASVVDMRVKVLGGYVTVERQFMDGKWLVNPRWKPAELGGQPSGENFCQAYPQIKIQDRTYSGDGQGWTLENRYSVRTTDYFTGTGCAANRIKTLRWQDRTTGNWMEYRRNDASTLQFQLVKYGDRNNVAVSLVYDDQNRLHEVRDHSGSLVFKYAYVNGLLTEIQDNPALIPGNTAPLRRVKYEYATTSRAGQSYPVIVKVTDVLGNPTLYTVTGGNLTAVTDAEGRKTQYQYTADRITKTIAPDGAETTYVYEYDKLKRQFYVRVTEPPAASSGGNRVTESWYDDQGILLRQAVGGIDLYQKTVEDTANRHETYTLAPGRKTEIVKDEFGNIIKTANPDGTITSASYSSIHGQVLEETDEAGVKTQYEFDSKGNRTKRIDAAGTPDQRVTEYEVNNLGQTVKFTRKGRTEANGTVTPDAIWLIEYGTQGQITQTTDPEGNVRRYDYDVAGNLLSYTDPLGKVWQYSYDANRNPLSETDPLGHSTQYAYDKVGNLLSAKDARDHLWRWVYDARNRETKSIDPYGSEFIHRFGVAGALSKVADASGKSSQFDYDTLSRLTRATDGKGQQTQFDYTDANGADKGVNRPGKIRYPTLQRLFSYDAMERVTQKSDVDGTEGRVDGFSYDAVGRRKTATDANGNTRYYDYDALGQVVNVKDPLGNAMSLLYDVRGNVIQVTEPNGQKTLFSYDRRNLLLSSTDPLGQTTRYRYDEHGWLLEIKQANGQAVGYAYDAAGRINRHQEYAADGTLQKTVDYQYDAADNLIGWSDGTVSATRQYDDADRLSSETINYGGFGLTHAYTYHANNQIKTYTGPDGVTISYEYDALGQFERATIPGEGQIAVTDWQWTSPKKVLLPGGTTQFMDYDGYQSLTRLKVVDPGQVTVFELQNQFGKLAEIKQSTADGTPRDYRYDDVTRLKSVDVSASPASNESFEYDSASNRIRDGKTGDAVWRYDAAGQLSQRGSISYRYDASGNQIEQTDTRKAGPLRTTRYAYDAFNRLVDIRDGAGAVVASYTYDPFDRRLSKTLGSGATASTTYFLPNAWGLLAETDADGNVKTVYGWHPQTENGTYPLFARVDNADGGKRYVYYHNDHLATPQRVTDKSGTVVWAADYDSFGHANERTVTGQPFANPLRYPGQYYDAESGLHYNDRRYYDPATGRYTTRDPIGLEGGINLYAYAAQSPGNFADPTGEIIPCLLFNYARCFLACNAIGGIGDFFLNCQQVNWADNAKNCAKDCLWDMLPLPNPCGKFGKLFGIAAGVAGGLMNSFPADTPVHVMPEGVTEADAHTGQSALKPIGDIKPGDRVLAFAEWKDKGTGAKTDARLSYERVEHTIVSEHQQRLVHITLESGETLTATDGHPFRTANGWRDAIMLKKGGQLLLKGDGEPPKVGAAQTSHTATITDVSTETRSVKVFNLEVENAHTYFVGKDGVGVHNGYSKTPGMHGHHIYPQEFRKEFKDAGIKIDDHIVDLNPRFHLCDVHGGKGFGRGGRYNKAWRDFFGNGGGRTKDEITDFSDYLRNKFGF